MPSPEETTAAVRELLADHPEAAEPLATLIERDADGEPWTFAETEFDSGLFGEVVARDLTESVDDGYRLHHPDAIRDALEAVPSDDDSASMAIDTAAIDETAGSDRGTSESQTLMTRLERLITIDPVRVASLIGALMIVAAARLVAAPAVFQDGFVVSPANDTYFFRYWQERLAARATGIFDVGLFADMGGAASTRPLSHAINWWVTVLVGGVEAAPMVAAWLPVVAAVLLGYVVYRLAWLLTGDVRVALAAVLFYGLAPVNVVYTSVGFLDHQAHQYLWLGLLILALTTLAGDVARRSRSTSPAAAARAHAGTPTMWVVAAGLAVTVAASAHLWGGSPLTFIPVAAVVGFRVALDVRHNGSPMYGNAPLVAGLAGGAGLALAAHQWLGWHETIAAITPLLVAGGALAIVTTGEVWRRTDLAAVGLVGIEVIVAIGGLLAYRTLRPQDVARFRTRAADLFFREGATETASLFSPDFAVVFGPLLQLGLGFYFAVVVLAVATWAVARQYEPGWLVLVCFGWYYTLLATIQVRFAGQLAIVIAPFAGIGLVYLLAAVDIARPVDVLGRANSAGDTTETPRPQRSSGENSGGSLLDRIKDTDDTREVTTLRLPTDNRTRAYLVAAVALVLLFNLILVPPLVGQTTHDQAQFEAAQTIDSHADSVAREYPANFVLSQWGDNRMYNYFVSGEAQSYEYAQSNHAAFLAGADPGSWYDQFEGRVGYVVLTDREGTFPANTTYTALYNGRGIGTNNTTATGHYQLLASADGVRTFAVVPGAIIEVTGSDGERVTATTTVQVGNENHTYTRSAPVSNGTATVRVAHSGEYTVGNQIVTVTDKDVTRGNRTQITLG
jgi:dolichyl-diphosphooligosaccharide--protein glycosyltransferase